MTVHLNAGNYRLQGAYRVLAGQYPSASILVTDRRNREGMFHVGFDSHGDITHVAHYGGSFANPTERLIEQIRKAAHQARIAA